MTKKYFFICIAALLLLSHALQAQKADFSADKTKGCDYVSVKFTDKSTGATSWQWDLGNGNQSIEKNPEATYTKPGKYTIKLSINNGASTEIKKEYIIVYGIDVDFSFDVSKGCAPLQVKFNDKTEVNHGKITSWLWNFGDGNRSDLQNPTHNYTFGGEHKVLLTVEVDNMCKSSLYLEDSPVNVYHNASPNFEIDEVSCDYPRDVTFSDKTSIKGVANPLDEITAWKWSFGDSKTSKEQNPVHTYSTEGEFDVTLEISTEHCTSKATKKGIVDIKNEKVDFSATSKKVCTGQTIEFTSDVPAGSSVRWNFGDSEYNSYYSTHSYYKDGNYDITMLVTFWNGCKKEEVKEKFITVHQSPTASFYADKSYGGYVPYQVDFTNRAKNADDVEWIFGDGETKKDNASKIQHDYKKFGVFDVTQIASNKNCADTLTKESIVQLVEPKIQIHADTTMGCTPTTINFSITESSIDPITSYEWDFGDGETSTEKNPQHTYTTTGNFDVSVKATTTTSYSFTTTSKEFIHIGTELDLDYAIVQDNFSASAPITFKCNTKDVDSVSIFIDDVCVKSYVPETYPFSFEFLPIKKEGTFDVLVVAYNKGCRCEKVTGDGVCVKFPIALFELDTLSFCQIPATILITDKSIEADTYYWDFGDGQTFDTNQTEHTYTETGNYEVTLITTNYLTNVTDTARAMVHVQVTEPVFSVDTVYGCYPLSIQCLNNSKTSGKIISQNWTVNGAAVSYNEDFSYTFYEPGEYNINLNVAEEYGCIETAKTDSAIHVYGPVPSIELPDDTACMKTELEFTNATQSFYDVETWKWELGNFYTDSVEQISYTFKNKGTTPVSLTATDIKGCTHRYDTAITIVFPYIYFSPGYNICTGVEIQPTNYSYGFDPKFAWDFGDGTTSDSIMPVHTYAKEGKYEIELAVTDRFGCSDTSIKSLNVVNPIIDFEVSMTDLGCAGDAPPVQFVPKCSPDITEWMWYFGDGDSSFFESPVNKYPPGLFTVSLVGKSYAGCQRSHTVPELISADGPPADFSVDGAIGCVPLDVEFNAKPTIKEISWDFGDGTELDPQLNTSHTYTYPGRFLPYVTLVDTNNCDFTYDAPEIIAEPTPIANDDNFELFEDSTLVFNIIENDSISDVLFTGLTLLDDSIPGRIDSINGSEFRFQPNKDYYGVIKFLYYINYNVSDTDTAMVTITVKNIPDKPDFKDETRNIAKITDLDIHIPDIIYDGDNNLDYGTVKFITQPNHGKVEVSDSGTIDYTPEYGYKGSDAYEFKICDSTNNCGQSKITLYFYNMPYPPVAVDDEVNLDEDASAQILVKENDYDYESSVASMEISILHEGNNGSAIIEGNSVKYVPNKDFFGNDTIKYLLSETDELFDSALIFITVNPIDDPIYALDDTIYMGQGQDTVFYLNIVDPDLMHHPELTSLKFSVLPQKGALTVLNQDSALVKYMPDNFYYGNDKLFFSACDIENTCDSASLTFIIEQNHVPVAEPDTFQTDEDLVLTLSYPVLFKKIEDDTLDWNSVVIKEITNGGAIIKGSNDALIITPEKDSSNTMVLKYSVCDIYNSCIENTSFIEVYPVEDAPRLTGSNELYIAQGGIDTLKIAEQYTDPENNIDLNSVLIVNETTDGLSLVNIGNGEFEANHTQFANLSKPEQSVLITICDVTGACTTDTFHIMYEPYSTSIKADKGFSPNGDGINDYLVIENITKYPKNEIIIFNRWGTEVYRKTGYDNTWDGKSKNNNVLPDGVYFYILHTLPGQKPLKKYFHLKTQ